jgi:hypothetical protein
VRKRKCLFFTDLAFLQLFHEIGQRDFFSLRTLRRERIANLLQKGGTFLHVPLQAACVGVATLLLGEVGGFQRNRVEPVANFVRIDLEKLLEFRAADLRRFLGTG